MGCIFDKRDIYTDQPDKNSAVLNELLTLQNRVDVLQGDITELSKKYGLTNIDDALSLSSTNAVQNKVVSENLNLKANVTDLENVLAKIQQVDMTAVLVGNKIKCYLDDTLSDFIFTNKVLYKFNIVFPIALLNNDLPNNYVIELYDKIYSESETANKIVVNNYFHISNLTSATVGDMCTLQKYDVNTGVNWGFNGRYFEFVDNGVTYRTVYTSDVVGALNTAMTGADLYVNIVNNSLKTGTNVFCLSDYTNGSVSYSAGINYKITGTVIDNDLIIDAEPLHDMTREDVTHKVNVINPTEPTATNYVGEVGLVNFNKDNYLKLNGNNASNTNIENLQSVLNNMTMPELGTILSNKQAVVKDTYRSSDGLTWYRIWSDGFKECGGKGQTVNSSGAQINLPIEFSDLHYVCLGVVTDSSGYPLQYMETQTTSRIYVKVNQSGNKIFRFYCCGY